MSGVRPGVGVTAQDRADWIAWAGARATHAFDLGQSLAARGRGAESLRWLERAHRLAPADTATGFALALALLSNRAPERAALMLDTIAPAEDCGAAWAALVVALEAAGRVADAAAAAARMLRRHVVPDGLAPLLDRLAAASGRPGWLGVGPAGLVLRPAGAALRQDGCALPPGRRAQMSGTLEATLDGAALLGSPLDLAVLYRMEGAVEAGADGLLGWAWHPGDPDRPPVLALDRRGLRGRTLVASGDPPAGLPGLRLLARPRGISLPFAALPAGMLHVRDAAGGDLLGSPLAPGLFATAAAAASDASARRAGGSGLAAPPSAPKWLVPVPAAHCGGPPRVGRRAPAADVVVPVHGGGAITIACLDSVLASLPRGSRLIVVDDCSPQPALVAALDRLAGSGRIRLLRNTRRLGYPGSANAGMSAAEGRDVALLNSDTLVPPAWLERLREAAHSAPDIGTATPFSNDATLMTYPDPATPSPMPGLDETARLDRLARSACGEGVVELPTAHGFCMLVRRDCLAQTGAFRPELFAQGYGEENDFCLRARHLGWRHVGVPGVFVAHAGSGSFGAARAHLVRRNMALLNRLHPGYDAMIADHFADDPLAPWRRRLDVARFRADRPRGARAVLLVTHSGGGGVERMVGERVAALRAEGRRPVLLRPDPAGCAVAAPPHDYPALRFALPGERRDLVRLLRAERPVGAELHHTLGHAADLVELLGELDLPYDSYVHDYARFCQRIALVGAERRYCGEPDVAGCIRCIDATGSLLGEAIGVPALLARSASELAGAQRVVAPSADVARRLHRHFPAIRPRVVPWEDDAARPAVPPTAAAAGRLRVCIPGAIGVEKGYDEVLAAVRDAAARVLPLDFVVVGHTIDDRRLTEAGPVFVTGEYAEAEAEALIRAQSCDLAWIPSVWPETWCYTLGLAWQAGLRTMAFDLGTPAERIRATGWGWLLPLGCGAVATNDALLRVGGGASTPRLPQFARA